MKDNNKEPGEELFDVSEKGNTIAKLKEEKKNQNLIPNIK